MIPARKIREYALHVRQDGVEVRVRRLPEMVYRDHVELEDGTLVEETTICRRWCVRFADPNRRRRSLPS